MDENQRDAERLTELVSKFLDDIGEDHDPQMVGEMDVQQHFTTACDEGFACWLARIPGEAQQIVLKDGLKHAFQNCYQSAYERGVNEGAKVFTEIMKKEAVSILLSSNPSEMQASREDLTRILRNAIQRNKKPKGDT